MDAAIDENSRQTITARLNTNGTTVTRIKVDPSTHAISVDDNSTGSDNGGSNAATDSNGRITMFAESRNGDNVLVALYATSAGLLLVDSN